MQYLLVVASLIAYAAAQKTTIGHKNACHTAGRTHCDKNTPVPATLKNETVICIHKAMNSVKRQSCPGVTDNTPCWGQQHATTTIEHSFNGGQQWSTGGPPRPPAGRKTPHGEYIKAHGNCMREQVADCMAKHEPCKGEKPASCSHEQANELKRLIKECTKP